MDIAVGRDGGAHVDADRGRVDELDLADPFGLEAQNMPRKPFSGDLSLQSWDEALQYHRRLSGPGNARYDAQPPLRERHLQRLHRMDRPRPHLHRPVGENVVLCHSERSEGISSLSQERPDPRRRIPANIGHRSLCNDVSALRSRLRAQLDDPVRMGKDLRVVVHQDDGVAVGHEVIHHARKPLQIRRMQADGRFVQHIQHARRPVPDGAGQLHPLALPRGQRRSRPVQRQVGKAQVHQPLGRILEGFADAFGHRAHGFRQGSRDAIDPVDEFGKGHLAGLGEGNPAEPRRPGGLRQARSVAVGAGILLEELLHPLHPGLVLDLGEGVLHAVNGVVVGEIHLREVVRLLVAVQDMLLFGRAVIDDLFLFRRQVLEGDVGPDAHLPGDVLHQGPHQRSPGQDRSFVDGQVLVGHEGRFVHGAHDSRSSASAAGALAVESKFLSARCIEVRSADGAHLFLLGGDGEGRLEIVPVGTPVAGEAGEHQPQAVQQLRHRSERAPDARHPRPLMQGQGRRHIAHVIHLCPCRLRHPPPRIGGQRLQVPPRPFRVQYP